MATQKPRQPDRPIDPEHARWEAKYRAIYDAGLRFAAQLEEGRDVHYRHFLEQQWRPSRLVDFGCGEGHHAATAASYGYHVLGIDAAPSAVARAKAAYPEIDFLHADVCQLNDLPADSFDVGVDLGCLHMFRRDDAAAQYLAQSFRVLQPGGLCYFQERVPASDAAAWFPQQGELVEWWRQRSEGPRPTVMTSTYLGGPHPVEVTHPVIDAALRTVQQHVALIAGAGFEVVQVRVVTPGANAPFEVIVIAQKPERPRVESGE